MTTYNHPGAGDHSNDLWNLPDLEDEGIMRPEHAVWGLDSWPTFNDPSPSMSMNQPVAGIDWAAATLSNYFNNPTANGSGFGSSIPGHGPAFSMFESNIEFQTPQKTIYPESNQGQPVSTPALPVTDSNIEFQLPLETVLSKFGQEEPAYNFAGGANERNSTRTNSRLSPEKWEKWKPEIERLYFQLGSTLEDTMTKMAEKGFRAGKTSYKKKIKEWCWETYERDKEGGNSAGEVSAVKSAKRIRGRAPTHRATALEENFQLNWLSNDVLAAFAHSQPANTKPLPVYSSNTHFLPWHQYPAQFTSLHLNPSAVYHGTPQATCSSSTTVSTLMPPHYPSMSVNPTQVSMGILAPMRDNEFNELMNTILNNVKDLYISYPAQKKWKVQRHRVIEEDEHIDLYTRVGISLHNSRSLKLAIGKKNFKNTLEMLGKVVGVGKDADCGLFSLPAIWTTFLRLIRGERPDWAKQLLSAALRLATKKFGCKHQFVQVLSSLQSIWKMNPDQITEVVVAAYSRCIEDVKNALGPLHLTTLSLRSEFLALLNGGSVYDIQALVEDIRSVIKIGEEEEGPDSGFNSHYTIKLSGLIIYVLLSNSSSLTIANQAENITKDLHRRVEEKKAEAGGQLEGELFTRWKILKRLMGQFCLSKGNYHDAIGFLEEFLKFDIMDESDAFALEFLGLCYEAVGRHDAATDVRKRRMEFFEMLLQKPKEIAAEGGKGANNHEETPKEDGGNVEGVERSSEVTEVNEPEERGQENLLENTDDDFGDSEVEEQLLEEQIAGLQQRLKALKRKRASKETA